MFHDLFSELHSFCQCMDLEDIHTIITYSIPPYINIKLHWSKKIVLNSNIMCYTIQNFGAYIFTSPSATPNS